MRFKYLEPATIEEAISLLGEYDDKAKVIAGGTDVMVLIRNKTLKPEYVIDITNIPGLNCIDYDDKGLRIGALTTISEIEKSEVTRQHYPIISQAAGKLGSIAIRNVATIGGNLCNAVPSADTAQPLVALSARTKIIGPDGERVLPIEEFLIGVSKTALKTGELLVEIQVPVPAPGTRGVYLKYTRTAVDLAMVGVAIVMTVEDSDVCRDVKIVCGAVAPTPMRASKAEEVIRGKRIDQALIDRCAQEASNEASPRASSIRGTPEEKKEVIALFVKEAIEQILAK